MKYIASILGMMMVMGWAVNAQAEGNRIGAGIHYWRAIDDIDVDNVEEDGIAYVVTYQHLLGDLAKLQLDCEIFTDDFAGNTDTTYAPQGFLLIGSGLYGGLGAGINYSDGDWADDPFYMLRVGFDLELLPGIRLDLNGNYRFLDFDEIKDVDENVDTDVITLGAAVRFEF